MAKKEQTIPMVSFLTTEYGNDKGIVLAFQDMTDWEIAQLLRDTCYGAMRREEWAKQREQELRDEVTAELTEVREAGGKPDPQGKENTTAYSTKLERLVERLEMQIEQVQRATAFFVDAKKAFKQATGEEWKAPNVGRAKSGESMANRLKKLAVA